MSIAIHQLVAVAWLALIVWATIEVVSLAGWCLHRIRSIEWGPAIVIGYLTLRPVILCVVVGYFGSSVLVIAEPTGSLAVAAPWASLDCPLLMILAAGRSVPPWHPQQSTKAF